MEVKEMTGDILDLVVNKVIGNILEDEGDIDRKGKLGEMIGMYQKTRGIRKRSQKMRIKAFLNESNFINLLLSFLVCLEINDLHGIMLYSKR